MGEQNRQQNKKGRKAALLQLNKSWLCIFSGMLQQQGIFKVLNKTHVRRVKTL